MKKSVVITSIFSPTESVRKFAANKEYKLIVVGDKKTPSNWQSENVEYLSVAAQEGLGLDLAKKLPYNHYCRKMVGYLKSVINGDEVIVDTDDDNIPFDDWSVPEFNGDYLQSPGDLGFVNIYKSFTDANIWPRGLPLDKILDAAANNSLHQGSEINHCNVGVWQGLADGDPDVDAIYRLTSNKECIFEKRDPLVLSPNTICPFNSQNTSFRKECFPLLYLPAFVTFRFTDILRGLVAQPILWEAGYTLGFTKATVFQDRNPHSYIRDFESEIPVYLQGHRVIDIVSGIISSKSSISDNLINAYEALEKESIVSKQELDLLNCWIKDLDKWSK